MVFEVTYELVRKQQNNVMLCTVCALTRCQYEGGCCHIFYDYRSADPIRNQRIHEKTDSFRRDFYFLPNYSKINVILKINIFTKFYKNSHMHYAWK